MKYSDIMELWRKDADIDRSELGIESLNIPKLQSKYFNLFSQHRVVLRNLELQKKALFKDKFEYYTGTLDYETMQQHKWQPFERKVIRSDIGMYIDADDDMIGLNLRIAAAQEKVSLLESILGSINQRNWIIKNTIDWERFKQGG